MEDRCGRGSQHASATCSSYQLLVPPRPLGPKGWGSAHLKAAKALMGRNPFQKENTSKESRLPSLPRPVAVLGGLHGVSSKLNQ